MNGLLGDVPSRRMDNGIGEGLKDTLGWKGRIAPQQREWLEIYTRERVTMKDAQAYR